MRDRPLERPGLEPLDSSTWPRASGWGFAALIVLDGRCSVGDKPTPGALCEFFNRLGVPIENRCWCVFEHLVTQTLHVFDTVSRTTNDLDIDPATFRQCVRNRLTLPHLGHQHHQITRSLTTPDDQTVTKLA